MPKSVYLAGPDVFFPNAIEVGKKKNEICARYGLIGLYPLDNEIEENGLSPRKIAIEIFKANCNLMDQADAFIANLTPFRGPSADVGTAFELGYIYAQNKPLFCYSNIAGSYLNKALQLGLVDKQAEGLKDANGFEIEDFGLEDNLMLTAAAILRQAPLLTPPDGKTLLHDELSLFAACVEQAAHRLKS